MDLLIAGFFIVWHAKLLSRVAVVAVMLRRRLGRCYPVFTVWTAVGFVHGTCLLATYYLYGSRAYAATWNATQPYSIAAAALAALECFWLVARHFRNVRAVAVFVAVLVAAGSAGLAALIIRVAVEPEWESGRHLLWWTQVGSAGSAILAAGGLLFWQTLDPRMRFRRNVLLHALILSVYLATDALGVAIIQSNLLHGVPIMVGHLVQQGSALCCYIAWVNAIRPNGEHFQPPVPAILD